MRYRESKKGGNRMQSKGKMSMKDYDMCESHVSETYTADWSPLKDSPMNQQDNGSMNYLNRKDAHDMSDYKKIKGSILPQS